VWTISQTATANLSQTPFIAALKILAINPAAEADRVARRWFQLGGGPMSERSVYLRDQAEKCRARAARMTDEETRQQLHVLAAEYIMRAVMVESDEPSYGNRK
jgi:hypothetical protein